ncbi:MAG: hypothetical protein CO095_17105 [Armatimonadetes bacterium CG_4_9_14_3_um_filter_58_7]|nr:MAG: hypothetical protein CO095_17105 [Armatimonadetes bacterium CG_4_9_14_3_um_filter_58_7]
MNHARIAGQSSRQLCSLVTQKPATRTDEGHKPCCGCVRKAIGVNDHQHLHCAEGAALGDDLFMRDVTLAEDAEE